jgi:hypothetical protein
MRLIVVVLHGTKLSSKQNYLNRGYALKSSSALLQNSAIRKFRVNQEGFKLNVQHQLWPVLMVLMYSAKNYI